MKNDEKIFFVYCYILGRREAYQARRVEPRYIINDFEMIGFMHHKRCWYLLEKWRRLGFYDYGTNLELGWFYPNKLPERYKKILEE